MDPTFAKLLYPVFPFLLPGGYYTIEIASSRIRLVSLNMNLYLSGSSGVGSSASSSSSSSSSSSRSRGPHSNVLNERYSHDVDPELSWKWLHKVMDEARKKRQNVSENKW